MATTADIDVLIDQYCKAYAPEFFHDLNGNRILHLINQNAGGGGGGGAAFSTLFVTSADFTTDTVCPIPALNGQKLALFWNDVPKYLKKGTDWTPLVGGGFTILVPGFLALSNSYTIVITPAAV